MGTETTEMINWVVGVFLVGIISLIGGAISVIKAMRMLPKEEHSADLDNISKSLELKSREVSIADQLDALATKAAEKTIKVQDRLDKLEEDYDTLESIIREQA